MKVKFLGKELGEASGWDGDLGECFWVYDFVPSKDSILPACECLQFDEVKGKLRIQDNQGDDLKVFDINFTLTEERK